MNSESTVKMYSELLSDCFDMRRSLYNLHGRRGMLVADAFTGNFAKRSGHSEPDGLFCSVLSFAMLQFSNSF